MQYKYTTYTYEYTFILNLYYYIDEIFYNIILSLYYYVINL